MGRSLRITEPGLWHHVMNRGQGGRELFDDDEDRQQFLKLLGEVGRRWDVWPCAYCLMTNHYHLLLHDESGLLSRAMRHVDGVYTQWFNRKYRTDGSLMRGRFRSRVVQSEGYVAEVVRYIHTNPLGPGLAERAGDYSWSSHHAYLQTEPHDWLMRGEVLKLLGLTLGTHAAGFDEFVHERVDAEVAERLADKRWSPILGDDSFVEQCRQLVREDNRLKHPDVTAGRRLAALTVDEVIAAACETFGVERDELLSVKRGTRNVLRSLTVLVCREMTPATGRAIGAAFGVHFATVAWTAGRAASQATEEPEVARLLAQLRQKLQQ